MAVREMIGRCQGDDREMSGRCQGDVREMPGRCQEDDRETSSDAREPSVPISGGVDDVPPTASLAATRSKCRNTPAVTSVGDQMAKRDTKPPPAMAAATAEPAAIAPRKPTRAAAAPELCRRCSSGSDLQAARQPSGSGRRSVRPIAGMYTRRKN